MSEKGAILEFRSAELIPPDRLSGRISGISLILEPGAASVVQTAIPADFQDDLDSIPLADAAEGLLACEKGQVLFLGRDWASMPPLEQAQNRSRIGRLFDFHGWVYNLSVMENLVVSSRSYGRLDPEPEAEAVAMARRFGLAGVPEGRPVLLRNYEKRVFEWIRAFLGRRDLIILERPDLDMPRRALEIGFELAQEAMNRGAALLWITHDQEIAERVIKSGASSYWMKGSTWHAGRRTT